MESLFSFPQSAKKAALEMGVTKYVVATTSGHVLHSEGCVAALEPAPFTRALTPS